MLPLPIATDGISLRDVRNKNKKYGKKPPLGGFLRQDVPFWGRKWPEKTFLKFFQKNSKKVLTNEFRFAIIQKLSARTANKMEA